MRILLTLFLFLSVLGFGGSASATTFDVSGSFPAIGNISGTITIDTSFGTVTAADFINPGFAPGQNIVSQFESTGVYEVEFIPTPGRTELVTIFNPNSSFANGFSGSLRGYQGGNFSVELDTVGLAPFVGSGTLTPEVAATPLPAALPLYATGLAAIGLIRWRRKRKAAVLAG